MSPSSCPLRQPDRPGPTRRKPRRAQGSYTTSRDTIGWFVLAIIKGVAIHTWPRQVRRPFDVQRIGGIDKRMLDFARFGGHLFSWEKGVHDVDDACALSTIRVPGADGRAGSLGPLTGGAGSIRSVIRSALPEELAREFEPSAQSIRDWVNQAGRDEGRSHDGLTSAEREELRRLRRENRQLRQEREMPARAAASFARETGSIPSESSSS